MTTFRRWPTEKYGNLCFVKFSAVAFPWRPLFTRLLKNIFWLQSLLLRYLYLAYSSARLSWLDSNTGRMDAGYISAVSDLQNIIVDLKWCPSASQAAVFPFVLPWSCQMARQRFWGNLYSASYQAIVGSKAPIWRSHWLLPQIEQVTIMTTVSEGRPLGRGNFVSATKKTVGK